MRKFLTLVLCLALIAAVTAGCGGAPAKEAPAKQAAAAKVIKLGHCHPPDSQFHLGSVRFAELVSKMTNGQVKIEIYHSSQLGDEPELSEAVRMGTNDMALLATGNVAKFEPKFNMFDLPFLFRGSCPCRQSVCR